jgi:YggT family protein
LKFVKVEGIHPSLHQQRKEPTMRSATTTAAIAAILAVCLASLASTASASVFLPTHNTQGKNAPLAFSAAAAARSIHKKSSLRSSRSIYRTVGSGNTAMAIPGYGVAEQVLVGGFSNFLGAYNIVITARVLLSWFPQAQGIAILQPVFAITDPYLNLFRGIIPPIFGLDLSPLAAFFLLNVMTSATAAVGCEIPANSKTNNKHNAAVFGPRPNFVQRHFQRNSKPATTTLNY